MFDHWYGRTSPCRPKLHRLLDVVFSRRGNNSSIQISPMILKVRGVGIQDVIVSEVSRQGESWNGDLVTAPLLVKR
jgi:hypothetical protein